LVRTSVTVWAGERKKFCRRTKTPNNRETLSLFAFSTHRFGRGGAIKMFRFELEIRFRNQSETIAVGPRSGENTSVFLSSA